MRKLRNFCFILFIVTLAVFLLYEIRVRSVRDGSGPVITMASDTIEVSIEDPEEALLDGITAADRRDGNVTESIVIEGLSTFLRPNTRIVRYAAFDRDLHVTYAQREMVYADYKSPEFSISAPLVFPAGSSGLLDHVSVTDCLDGDLSDSVKILADSMLQVKTAGDYDVILQAANSAGDVASLPVTIRIKDTLRGEPQVQLKNYVFYLDKNASFDPYELITGVQISGGLYEVVSGRGTFGDPNRDRNRKETVGTSQINITNPVNTAEPGTYKVIYSMTVEGNYGERVIGETDLYVVVRGDK